MRWWRRPQRLSRPRPCPPPPKGAAQPARRVGACAAGAVRAVPGQGRLPCGRLPRQAVLQIRGGDGAAGGRAGAALCGCGCGCWARLQSRARLLGRATWLGASRLPARAPRSRLAVAPLAQALSTSPPGPNPSPQPPLVAQVYRAELHVRLKLGLRQALLFRLRPGAIWAWALAAAGLVLSGTGAAGLAASLLLLKLALPRGEGGCRRQALELLRWRHAGGSACRGSSTCCLPSQLPALRCAACCRRAGRAGAGGGRAAGQVGLPFWRGPGFGAVGRGGRRR
jgi:hypothetical protein